ncbi:MAG: hypothetical protein A2505_07430 [Deltaproteobacteria bacterium RIFOXYD12_FULL_55_16]|nr:MAG: hypothetical protein A2505_07430 [Deltaproteobacteria bacterium RIFOXYD12_FULL_55_16]
MTAPRARQEGRLRRLAGDLLSLFQGLGLTFGYFISPARVITQQYPENKASLRMTPRFRGRLVMPKDEAGNHRCTACGLCEKACPNGSISVLSEKDSAGRKVLGRYLYRLSQCALCNLCVEACPFGAIAMGQAFELAVYDREQLTLVLNQKEETTTNV